MYCKLITPLMLQKEMKKILKENLFTVIIDKYTYLNASELIMYHVIAFKSRNLKIKQQL